MKRYAVTALMLAALMLISAFAGCISIDLPANSPEPTGEPAVTPEPPVDNTEPPADTEPPAETDPPADPTDPPVTVPDVGNGIIIPNGEDGLSIDIDCDGMPDNVRLLFTPSEGSGETYTISLLISLGNGKITDYRLDSEERMLIANALVVDFDTNDNRLDIVFGTIHEEDNNTVYALKVDESGSGIDLCRTEGYLDQDHFGGVFFRDGLICIKSYTDVMGTYTVFAEFSADKTGFIRRSDSFTYYENWFGIEYSPRVLKDLPAFSVNEDGTKGEPMTVKKGSMLDPVYSDLETYVVVQLRDGTLVYIEIGVDASGGIFVSGHPQDYYLEVFYAD